MANAVVLMYHNINTPPKKVDIPNLYVTPRMFRFQMWYLKRSGFQVVTLQEMMRRVREKNTKTKMVALTFDDGYQDFYENAYPVLKRYGYSSTVFIMPGRMAKVNGPDGTGEQAQKPLMDWETVAEISRNNVVIGSHTMTHPSLVDIPIKEAVRELTESKKEIEKKIQQPVDCFCYPYGKYDDRVREEVKNAGYVCSVSTMRGSVEPLFDPYGLKRVPVKLTTNPLFFIHRIHKRY